MPIIVDGGSRHNQEPKQGLENIYEMIMRAKACSREEAEIMAVSALATGRIDDLMGVFMVPSKSMPVIEKNHAMSSPETAHTPQVERTTLSHLQRVLTNAFNDFSYPTGLDYDRSLRDKAHYYNEKLEEAMAREYFPVSLGGTQFDSRKQTIAIDVSNMWNIRTDPVCVITDKETGEEQRVKLSILVA